MSDLPVTTQLVMALRQDKAEGRTCGLRWGGLEEQIRRLSYRPDRRGLLNSLKHSCKVYDLPNLAAALARVEPTADHQLPLPTAW